MHGLDSLVVSAGEVVGAEDIFGVVVPDVQQAVILPAFGFLGGDPLCDLHIELFVLPRGHEVDLAVVGLADVYGVAPAAQLQIDHVFQAGGHGVRVVAQDAVPEGGVGQVEFLLGLQQLLPLQVIPGTAVEQIGLLQLVQIAVHRLIVQGPVLGFEIVGDGFGGERIAYMIKSVLHHPLQLVDLVDLIAPDDVGENGGVVDVADDGINFVPGIVLQMGGREAAEADIVRQLLPGVPHFGILAFEGEVLRKGQGENAEGDVAPGEIGGDFGGHHAGVGAGHIQVHVKVRLQGVDDFFPALDLLHLVQKEVGGSAGAEAAFQLGVHLLGGHVVVLHGVEAVADDLLRWDAALAQLIHDHLQNRGLPAAAHAGQNFHERGIGIGHNFFGIGRSVDHVGPPPFDHSIPQKYIVVNIFAVINRKT